MLVKYFRKVKCILSRVLIRTLNYTKAASDMLLFFITKSLFLTSTGEVKSFMRDCSDGKTFSFTDEVKFPRLLQVKGDNFTTCSYRLTANFHVCLSLCESDFCNAPRAPPPNETCNGTDNATCSARSLVLGFLPGVPLFSHVFVLPLLAFALSLLVVD